MTVREAAKILGTSRAWVRYLCQHAKLKAKRLIREGCCHYEIDRASVLAYKKAPKNKGGWPLGRPRKKTKK
jgi:excisionase family DNA binding protein